MLKVYEVRLISHLLTKKKLSGLISFLAKCKSWRPETKSNQIKQMISNDSSERFLTQFEKSLLRDTYQRGSIRTKRELEKRYEGLIQF